MRAKKNFGQWMKNPHSGWHGLPGLEPRRGRDERE